MHLFVQAVILGVLTGGVYALMSSGLVLSFGTMRVINLAQGAFVVLGAYLSYTLFAHTGLDPFITILITTPLLFAVGVTLQAWLLRPIRYNEESLSLLMTWAMAIGIEGVLSIVFGTDSKSILTAYVNDSWSFAGYRVAAVRVYAFVLSVFILLLLYLVLERTQFGRAVRATSQRASAAKLLGVNTDRVSALAFGLGAGTAAAAGAVFGLVYSFNPVSHYDLIGRLLTIVVLGGMTSYVGSVIGAVVLGVSEAVVQAMISPAWSSFPFYILLILVLILRPQGLFGVRERGAI